MTDIPAIDLDEEAARFCREDVYEPWLEALRIARGEVTSGWFRPFLGYGPRLPVRLVPLLTPPVGVRLALGRRANLVTVVLNRARNRVVFLAVERAERGRYVEMRRLDHEWPEETVSAVLRLVQAGAEAEAIELVGRTLAEQGLPELAPDVMKVADLHFFDAFAKLAALQREGRTLEWARESRRVARRVLRERLVYFYPPVPFERALALGRRLA